MTLQPATRIEEATFAGGCFWCIEAFFLRQSGIIDVLSGYTGGHTENPDYESVSSGTTGHAEAVRVRFDPDIVTYRELLELLFRMHDPTTLNRQGNDTGTQYRSAIFYHDERQREEAKQIIEEFERSGRFADPIVTEVVPVTQFYPAEEYHRDFYNKNPNHPYCLFVIRPKLK